MNICIIPTGDEIRSGTVRDTDSPAVMAHLLVRWPDAEIRRLPPVCDREGAIQVALDRAIEGGAELAIFIGGSGGGHRYSATLGRDYTHSALDRLLEGVAARSIYGQNGHLWSRLLCGTRRGARVINLPGPYVEAEAAIRAFCAHAEADVETTVQAMADAVIACYPVGTV